jgi:pyrroline-5-carboxylate reductase
VKTKIVIIGNGTMAEALCHGLKESYDNEVLGRDITKLNDFKSRVGNIKVTQFKGIYNTQDKNIILCTKPNSIVDVSKLLSGEADQFISVLAGVSIETIKEYFDAKSYVRAMPNLSAKYLKSTTSLVGQDVSLARELFKKIGSTVTLSSQKELDIATAIAGSGPAFLALIAEALEDGGVASGLKRETSRFLVNSLFDGFVPLVKNMPKPTIKDGVMSPNGTTAAGIVSMEKNGVRSAMIEAIGTAYKRAEELKAKS